MCIRDRVVTCESFMTIYDMGGTDLYIMDKKGVKKEIGTSWPIIKACIASQGTVAVLVSENENYYVKPVSYTHLDVYKRQEQEQVEVEERAIR